MSLEGNVMPRRKLIEKPKPWECECSAENYTDLRQINPGYLKRCPDCKAERPK